MLCGCGCGKETFGGTFLPGHDQKLRSQLENRVGGLQCLEKLVNISELYARGDLSLQELGNGIKILFRHVSVKADERTAGQQELLMSQVLQLDTVTRLLIKKGYFTEAEFFQELKEVQAEYLIKKGSEV